MNIKAVNVNGENYNICSSFIEVKNLGDYSIEYVDSLPATGTENTLYLMKTSSLNIVQPYIISSSTPSDTTKIWIDSANSNVPKVYNGSSWITLGSVWS